MDFLFLVDGGMQPAGTTLQAKDSLPIRENRVRLEDFVAVSALFWNSDSWTYNLSSESWASCHTVSSNMPSNGSRILGPTNIHGESYPSQSPSTREDLKKIIYISYN